MNIAEWHPRSKNIVLNIKAEALLNQYNFIFQTTLRRFISILQTAQIFYWMMPALKILSVGETISGKSELLVE